MKAAIIATLLAGLLIGGCAATEYTFRPDGIPHGKYYVGGGYSIDYSAPEKGTAYLVDINSGKMLITESLEAGESFYASFEPSESFDNLQAIGIEPTTYRPALYFVPQSVLAPEAEEPNE